MKMQDYRMLRRFLADYHSLWTCRRAYRQDFLKMVYTSRGYHFHAFHLAWAELWKSAYDAIGAMLKLTAVCRYAVMDGESEDAGEGEGQ